MILLANWHIKTGTVGQAAFATAAIASAAAWMRLGLASKTARLAAFLTLMESFFFFDIRFNWRWDIHQWFMEFFQAHHSYEQRKPVQIAALALLGLTLVLVLAISWKRVRRRWARVAVVGIFLSIACWVAEIISLHQVDGVLYSLHAGGLMLIAFVWAVLCAAVAIAVQMDAGDLIFARR